MPWYTHTVLCINETYVSHKRAACDILWSFLCYFSSASLDRLNWFYHPLMVWKTFDSMTWVPNLEILCSFSGLLFWLWTSVVSSVAYYFDYVPQWWSLLLFIFKKYNLTEAHEAREWVLDVKHGLYIYKPT